MAVQTAWERMSPTGKAQSIGGVPKQFGQGGQGLQSFTQTTLRPDYNRMISSSYGLQTALNERALRGLTPGKGTEGALGSLVENYNKAYQEAREANEARYQQLLDIADQTTSQRESDVRGAYGEQQANMMQRLARQGMAGTTIAPTMQTGVARERESALNRLADQMQQTKLGIIERREDKYPSQAPLMSALQSVGGQFGAEGLNLMLGALGKMEV